uniref:Uncharacterized protein n=1 Tax=Salix viminalis TaxID=40686 RepID=A0A6N2NLG2_SALVM
MTGKFHTSDSVLVVSSPSVLSLLQGASLLTKPKAPLSSSKTSTFLTPQQSTLSLSPISLISSCFLSIM